MQRDWSARVETQVLLHGIVHRGGFLAVGAEDSHEALYKKYRLTEDDISFIESRIRPMENGNE